MYRKKGLAYKHLFYESHPKRVFFLNPSLLLVLKKLPTLIKLTKRRKYPWANTHHPWRTACKTQNIACKNRTSCVRTAKEEMTKTANFTAPVSFPSCLHYNSSTYTEIPVWYLSEQRNSEQQFIGSLKFTASISLT